jgi:hypothetical protein
VLTREKRKRVNGDAVAITSLKERQSFHAQRLQGLELRVQ